MVGTRLVLSGVCSQCLDHENPIVKGGCGRSDVGFSSAKAKAKANVVKHWGTSKNQDEQQKRQPRHLFPKQALSHMQVQELNLTDLKKPVLSGNIELGFGYTRISTICSYSVEY